MCIRRTTIVLLKRRWIHFARVYLKYTNSNECFHSIHQRLHNRIYHNTTEYTQTHFALHTSASVTFSVCWLYFVSVRMACWMFVVCWLFWFMRACYLRLFFIQGHCHVIANNLYFTAFSVFCLCYWHRFNALSIYIWIITFSQSNSYF